MDIVALLVGLGPLLGWGLFPTIASLYGGKPVNQIFGATVGTLIFAAVFALIQGIVAADRNGFIIFFNFRCWLGFRTNYYF